MEKIFFLGGWWVLKRTLQGPTLLPPCGSDAAKWLSTENQVLWRVGESSIFLTNSNIFWMYFLGGRWQSQDWEWVPGSKCHRKKGMRSRNATYTATKKGILDAYSSHAMTGKLRSIWIVFVWILLGVQKNFFICLKMYFLFKIKTYGMFRKSCLNIYFLGLKWWTWPKL